MATRPQFIKNQRLVFNIQKVCEKIIIKNLFSGIAQKLFYVMLCLCYTFLIIIGS